MHKPLLCFFASKTKFMHEALRCGRWPFLTSDDFFFRPTGHRPLVSQFELSAKWKSQVSETKRTKSHCNICFLASVCSISCQCVAMATYTWRTTSSSLCLRPADRRTGRPACRLHRITNSRSCKVAEGKWGRILFLHLQSIWGDATGGVTWP